MTHSGNLPKTDGFFNFPQIDSEITVWLSIDNEEYEVSRFHVDFVQSSDHKGQPQDETRGGRMLLTLTQTLPNSFYRWAMTSSTKNGTVVFKSKTTNAPLKIEFKNAFCINFVRKVDVNTGVTTNLVISPEELVINGINFSNHWTK